MAQYDAIRSPDDALHRCDANPKRSWFCGRKWSYSMKLRRRVRIDSNPRSPVSYAATICDNEIVLATTLQNARYPASHRARSGSSALDPQFISMTDLRLTHQLPPDR